METLKSTWGQGCWVSQLLSAIFSQLTSLFLLQIWGLSWPYAEAPVSGHHPKSCTDFYLSMNMVIKKGWKPGRTSIYQFPTSRDCYPVFPQVRVVPVQNYLKYTSDSWHWVEAYQTPGNILQNLYWFSTNLIAQ